MKISVCQERERESSGERERSRERTLTKDGRLAKVADMKDALVIKEEVFEF